MIIKQKLGKKGFLEELIEQKMDKRVRQRKSTDTMHILVLDS